MTRHVLLSIAAAGLSLAAGPALGESFQCRGPDATYFLGIEPNEPDIVYGSTAFDPPLDHKQMEFALPIQPSGSGFRYANDFAEFYGKGTDAFFEIDGIRIACTHQGTIGGPLRVDTPGRSLGGKVRSGPGMEYDTVGSLAEGTPIVLETNTVIDMNGYPWFEISAGTMRGFQWGGIVCSEGRHVPGVYQQCGMPPPQ